MVVFMENCFFFLEEVNFVYFGIKGCQFCNVEIFFNIFQNCSFLVELLFENDYVVEMYNNFFGGVVLILKGGNWVILQLVGGVFLFEGEGFMLCNNYFSIVYLIEVVCLNMMIDSNFFDFVVDDDGGNLIIFFVGVCSIGYFGVLCFINNWVCNFGCGIFVGVLVINNVDFFNNYIVVDEIEEYLIEGGVVLGFLGFRID